MAEELTLQAVPTATVTDMSESDKVIKYCLQNHIDKEVIDEVLARGYTSMAALKLMDPSDLQSPKIPKGQRRLLMHIAKALSTDGASSVEPSPASAPEAPIVQPAATASTSGQNEQPVQAIYDQTLLNSLVAQQQQLGQTTGPTPMNITGNNCASPFNVLGKPQLGTIHRYILRQLLVSLLVTIMIYVTLCPVT